MEDFGNSIEEERKDMTVLHSKGIAGPSATKAVRKVKQTGEQHLKLLQENTLSRELMQKTIPYQEIS